MNQIDFDVTSYSKKQAIQNRYVEIFKLLPEKPNDILNIGCAYYNEETRKQNNLHKLLIDHTTANVAGIDIEEQAINQLKKKDITWNMLMLKTFH